MTLWKASSNDVLEMRAHIFEDPIVGQHCLQSAEGLCSCEKEESV